MKKIKLKLTQSELDTLTWFIEVVLLQYQNPHNHESKLLYACLTELYHKAMSAALLLKGEYKITVSVAMGLALVIYARKPVFVPSDDKITLNKLIGIIDQKTI